MKCSVYRVDVNGSQRLIAENSQASALTTSDLEAGLASVFVGLKRDIAAAGLSMPNAIAHLGNGSSLTAVRAGRSLDTTMGLTPTGEIPMGTRSGDLDPGLLLHLMREHHLDVASLAELLDHRAGLLGVSGLSSDMRQLHAAAPHNPAARLALEMFCYAVRKSLAAMAAVLEGVDMIVFTGGIGENDSRIRAAVCHGLNWLGAVLDEDRNKEGANIISAPASPCVVRVLPALESERIAHHSWRLTAP